MFKIIALVIALLPLSINTSCHLPTATNGNTDFTNNLQNTTILTQNSKKKVKIQVALLLDTSNSMDGLIDQAKSQIWKMVNRLAAAKKNDEATDIEIALFEYGNDNLEMGEGYVRMVNSLTSDMDAISEKLFALKTKGGSEYCGWVIGDAVANLKWSDDNDDMKLIIIAGNEPFDQGLRLRKPSVRKGPRQTGGRRSRGFQERDSWCRGACQIGRIGAACKLSRDRGRYRDRYRDQVHRRTAKTRNDVRRHAARDRVGGSKHAAPLSVHEG